jgi:hypothetical protein
LNQRPKLKLNIPKDNADPDVRNPSNQVRNPVALLTFIHCCLFIDFYPFSIFRSMSRMPPPHLPSPI